MADLQSKLTDLELSASEISDLQDFDPRFIEDYLSMKDDIKAIANHVEPPVGEPPQLLRDNLSGENDLLTAPTSNQAYILDQKTIANADAIGGAGQALAGHVADSENPHQTTLLNLADVINPNYINKAGEVPVIQPNEIDVLIRRLNALEIGFNDDNLGTGLSDLQALLEFIVSDLGAHTHLEVDITDLDKYTQAAVDALLNLKADISYVNNTTVALDGSRVMTGNLNINKVQPAFDFTSTFAGDGFNWRGEIANSNGWFYLSARLADDSASSYQYIFRPDGLFSTNFVQLGAAPTQPYHATRMDFVQAEDAQVLVDANTYTDSQVPAIHGVIDNLTSSGNSTDGLSANQGYELDQAKLDLTGGEINSGSSVSSLRVRAGAFVFDTFVNSAGIATLSFSGNSGVIQQISFNLNGTLGLQGTYVAPIQDTHLVPKKYADDLIRIIPRVEVASTTLTPNDEGKSVEINNAGAVNLTFDSAQNYPVGMQGIGVATGVGAITLTAAGTTTFRAAGNRLTTAEQNAPFTYYHVGSNVWQIAGDFV